MEYKGKQSKIVWNPICAYSPNGEEFNRSGVFAKKEDAMGLIKDWVHIVTHFNPKAFRIVEECDNVEIFSERTNQRLYEFQIWPMCYYD